MCTQPLWLIIIILTDELIFFRRVGGSKPPTRWTDEPPAMENIWITVPGLVNVYIANWLKSPFLMVKSTMSMVIFNSYVNVYQRVYDSQLPSGNQALPWNIPCFLRWVSHEKRAIHSWLSQTSLIWACSSTWLSGLVASISHITIVAGMRIPNS